jgi:hypothetical protein
MNFGRLVISGLLCIPLFPAQAGPGQRGMGIFGFGLDPGKVVTGLPYMADVNNTTVRTLIDGNTIQHTMSGHVARDRQGRSYMQVTVSSFFGQSGPRTFTMITDPTAGYSYSLHPDTKTASRRALHPVEASNGNASQPGASTQAGNPNAAVTELGTQVLNGIRTTGKKTVRTIPAGEVGNSQPIVSTNETWYSPDLQVVISSKRNDPRAGTSTYTLSNLQRIDPPAALFQVPGDYTIQDAPARPIGR